MKLDTIRHDVESNGMLAQRKFTVDAGAHIMAVLSGLYKNPVDAMVREYLTNMYDAYVALKRGGYAGAFTPPILHLPSALDGNLTFRDFGIGMSLDMVWSIFAVYGASTKNGSNDEVGGFGLGSKTAFCYNGGATWTIESRHEGLKHIFMAFIGEDGVPNLTHVSSTPTDEHSGLTISIPVRREDHNLCLEAARRYVPYFPMPITVEGATIMPVDYLLRSEGWGIRKSSGRYGEVSRIVMGNVPYPMDQNLVRSVRVPGVDDWTVREFLQSNAFDIFVKIGDVDIVPSRDDMKYTDKTKNTIAKAFAHLLKNLGDVVSTQLNACADEWSALKLYNGMTHIQRLQEVVKSITWNGNKIGTDGISRTLVQLQALDPSVKVTRYAITDSHRATMEVTESPETLVMAPYNRSFMVYDDIVKGSSMMARALVHNKLVNKSGAGRSMRYGHTVGHAYLIKTTLTATQLGTFFGGMPEDQVQSAAALKGVLPVPTSLKMTKDTIYRWSNTSWDARVNIPVGTKMYYLPLTKDTYSTRFAFVSNRYGSQKDAIQMIRSNASALGIEFVTLYGIKADDVKNFDSSWINLVDAMEAEVTAQVAKHAETFALASLRMTPEMIAMFQIITATRMDLHHAEMQEFQKNYNKIELASKSGIVYTVNQLTNRIPSLEQTRKKAEKSVKVPNMLDQMIAIRDKYPMFALLADMQSVSTYGNSRTELLRNNSDTVLDYIKSIS